MKVFRKLSWIVPLIQLFIMGVVLCCFQVDDMTLSKGEIDEFNRGWTLIREDGSKTAINSLPYSEKCKAGEKIVIENTIPQNYWGKTLSFLSADKTLKVTTDGNTIYQFGLNDKRLFGHTPGSIENFIDIPENLVEGHIVIEMNSPYDNFAATINSMTIARRDVAILSLLKHNLLNIICCIIVLFSGIIFAILALIRKISYQSTDGLVFLGMLALVACVYYAIETKALPVLYGNQTLYSILVFFSLMLLPMLLVLYYEKNLSGRHHKLFLVLLTLVSLNIGGQLILQLTNSLDFMNMAVFSHTLILATAVIMMVIFFKMALEERRKDVILEFIALFLLLSGSVIDIARTYVEKVGDLGKYSRYGMTAFCIIMLVEHLRRIAKSYSASIEENAKLLQREVVRQTQMAEQKEASFERLSYQIVMALVKAIDAKDTYTNGHSMRVAGYSREIARRLGMTEQQQQDIYYIGLLHDIGKIGIPDEIINKPGKLTDEEYNIIKRHPQIGADILQSISEMPGIEIGAGGHHERFDGKGYPNGLVGYNIPLIARIIGVADAYDAMSSRRSYRDVLPQNVVRQEIVRGMGKQFDPQIAGKMLEMIDQDVHYKMREV